MLSPHVGHRRQRHDAAARHRPAVGGPIASGRIRGCRDDRRAARLDSVDHAACLLERSRVSPSVPASAPSAVRADFELLAGSIAHLLIRSSGDDAAPECSAPTSPRCWLMLGTAPRRHDSRPSIRRAASSQHQSKGGLERTRPRHPAGRRLVRRRRAASRSPRSDRLGCDRRWAERASPVSIPLARHRPRHRPDGDLSGDARDRRSCSPARRPVRRRATRASCISAASTPSCRATSNCSAR